MFGSVWSLLKMLYATLLVLLGTCFLGCSSQQLSQPSVMGATPGADVSLSCILSPGFSISSGRVHWYQQKRGGVPVFVYHYYTSSDQGRGSGIPDRFSVTADTSSNRWSLVINGVQTEDDADYYCSSWYSSSFVFGGGTQLNVLTGETKAPTLSIFPPSQEEVEKNKATVVCLYQDFYPASLDVTWKVGGQTITNGVEKSRATKQSENNLFMASSYLSLPNVDWSADKTVTCQVTHQGKTFEKSVKKSECV